MPTTSSFNVVQNASKKPTMVDTPSMNLAPPRPSPLDEFASLGQEMMKHCLKPNADPRSPSQISSISRVPSDKSLKFKLDACIKCFEDVDRERNMLRSAAIDKICEILKACQIVTVSEIYKAGSLKKGTSIATSDVDLILVSEDLPTTQQWTWMPKLLILLEGVLRLSRLPISNMSMTRFSLQFVTDDDVHVDLLPTSAELWKMSLDERQHKRKSADPKEHPYWSASFAKDSCYRMKKLTESAPLTGLIRLVKRWRMAVPWDAGCTPHKYCLEILMIYSWRCAEGNIEEAFTKFWNLCAAPANLSITVTDQPISKTAPVVLDCVDPTNNLASQFKWYQLEKHAALISKKPELFFSVFYSPKKEEDEMATLSLN
eukprot:m.88472 g.88472  ORF g.88472 m.88472 type:complete len:373 (-) comp8810_c0_seq4:125-1243(-)